LLGLPPASSSEELTLEQLGNTAARSAARRAGVAREAEESRERRCCMEKLRSCWMEVLAERAVSIEISGELPVEGSSGPLLAEVFVEALIG
jgi:hypothetical protein